MREWNAPLLIWRELNDVAICTMGFCGSVVCESCQSLDDSNLQCDLLKSLFIYKVIGL